MLSARDFDIAQIQTSVFTRGMEVATARVLTFFYTSYPDVFTGEPTIIPQASATFAGEKVDVPQITLSSEDSRLRVQVSQQRCDLFWSPTDTSMEAEVNAHMPWATSLLQRYVEVTSATVGRLACVVRRVGPDDTPALTLAHHFCQKRWLERPLNRPTDFELHAHKKYITQAGLEVNSWVRCKTAILKRHDAEETEQSVVFVEQDLNTLAEEVDSREFESDEISSFFGTVLSEMDHTLLQYFPSDGQDAD